MIVTGSSQLGAQRRRHLRLADGFEYFKGEWLETGQAPDLSPTMFLVEQGPHSTLRTHFHRENEFQVVVQGGGLFGRHPVQAVAVHYAGAFTGYGPIVAGPEGLSYFTIRSIYESGAVMLPEGREQLPRGPKRQLYGARHEPADLEALARLRSVESSDLIPMQDDRIAARVMRIPCREIATAETPVGSGGQFHMVLAGGIVHEGRELRRWESVFVSPDEKPISLQAGNEGAEVLFLQLAPKAAEYSRETVA
jgi:hypothetical protein